MYTAEYLLQSVNEAIERENFLREPQELYEPITYIFSLGRKAYPAGDAADGS